MKKSTFKNIGFGASFGLTLVCTYEAIIITFQCILAAINGTSLVEIIEGVQTSLFYFSGFLLLPFPVICAFTGMIFIGTFSVQPHTKERSFILACMAFCVVISAMLYMATAHMIYNIDEPTKNYLNFVFRTIPSLLFLVWGYFFSLYIYRDKKTSSNDQHPSS